MTEISGLEEILFNLVGISSRRNAAIGNQSVKCSKALDLTVDGPDCILCVHLLAVYIADISRRILNEFIETKKSLHKDGNVFFDLFLGS